MRTSGAISKRLGFGTVRGKIETRMSDGQLRGWLDALAGVGGAVSAIEVAARARRGGAVPPRGGVSGRRRAARAGARFDAASLTKPWIASLALALDRDGRARARDGARGARIRPATRSSPAGRSRICLRHRSGLPAWMPLALRLGRRIAEPEALEELLTRGEPAGARAVRPAPTAISATCSGGSRRSAGPATRSPTSSTASSRRHSGCRRSGRSRAIRRARVECQLDNGREVQLAGEQGFEMRRQALRLVGRPQDGNARALGRLVGHAGLFTTVDEQLALAREWLAPGAALGPGRVAKALAGGTGWALGWTRASHDGSSGPAFSAAAFGHAGFTGGSLWIDPERELVVAVLAHRLDSATDFNPYRRELHRLAVEAFGMRLSRRGRCRR